MIGIELLKEKDRNFWNKYLVENSRATYCHLLGWREIIKNSYNLKDLYLVAKENSEVVGVLPLFEMGPFFKKKIVSLPFLNYGGLVCRDKAVGRCFDKYLRDYFLKDRSYIEIRSLSQLTLKQSFLNKENITAITKLHLNPEEVWKRIDKKARNQVRKAESYNLKFVIDKSCLRDFYSLYLKTMRKFGTPNHSLQFFKNIFRVFPRETNLFLVKFNEKFVAGMITFEFQKILANPWAASDPRYKRMNVNNFLYWRAIEWASKNGFCCFDLGRSQKDSSIIHFKEQWDAEFKPLHYYFLSKSDKKFFSPQKSKKKHLAFLYKFIPACFSNKIGPYLRKYLA